MRNLKVYPSPCRVNKGDNEITFAGLTTKNISIKIFNIAAELVFEKKGITTPPYSWNLKNNDEKTCC